MVGIVIVSHSAKLATGVKELARQMIQTDIPLAIAAGIDDPENPFGTDALQIQAAIESVSNPAGVVILMDLGSAIMSAEMAWEFLPEEQRKKAGGVTTPLKLALYKFHRLETPLSKWQFIDRSSH